MTLPGEQRSCAAVPLPKIVHFFLCLVTGVERTRIAVDQLRGVVALAPCAVACPVGRSHRNTHTRSGGWCPCALAVAQDKLRQPRAMALRNHEAVEAMLDRRRAPHLVGKQHVASAICTVKAQAMRERTAVVRSHGPPHVHKHV
eukprot:5100095-Prymnesium_polylepis.2